MSGAPATRTVTHWVTLGVICGTPTTPEGLGGTGRDTGLSVLMALGREAEVPQAHDTSLLEDTLVTMCQVVFSSGLVSQCPDSSSDWGVRRDSGLASPAGLGTLPPSYKITLVVSQDALGVQGKSGRVSGAKVERTHVCR